jgi:HEAT repeat protein
MPITLQQVRQQLDRDEPDYNALAALGVEALPHLAVLVRDDDPGLAAKAAYLASLLQGDDAADVVQAAAESPHETVRVAAAAGLRNLDKGRALPTVDRLLDDKDVGVRKQALRAVAALGLSALEPKVRAMAARDPEKALRTKARAGLRRAGAEGAGRGESRPTPTRGAKTRGGRRGKGRKK